MSQSSTPIVRHTDAEVESLKRQWRQDPCWDLADTDGFEAHRGELAAYEATYWAEAQQALERKEQAERQAQPAVKILACVQIYGSNDSKRRVAWVNPAAISHFTEFEPWRPDGVKRPRWTLVSMTSGEQLQIDASPEQFAGWLRGDRPRADPDEPTVEDVKARVA